ncbi:ATP synthase subunit delta, mitochondrial-like [Physella acuta]|uniref:ATP synthase subunit delta, mitochondrial-like n=1 Tax=Physella acuta TaxID=109671 RepID=UPI0027DC884B|nr:ATP synthase subunit delta, mitochondrial-like [Physella acuta]
MASIIARRSSRVYRLYETCSRSFSVGHRNNADMAFTFASPYDVYYKDAKVKQIDVPTFSGNFGILPSHVPTLAVLKPGVVNVFEEDGSQKKFFVSSGSVTINDDSSVQILAEEAHPIDRLDAGAIREGLTKAQHEVTSASSETAKAEAQIAVECFEALQKAVE